MLGLSLHPLQQGDVTFHEGIANLLRRFVAMRSTPALNVSLDNNKDIVGKFHGFEYPVVVLRDRRTAMYVTFQIGSIVSFACSDEKLVKAAEPPEREMSGAQLAEELYRLNREFQRLAEQQKKET